VRNALSLGVPHFDSRRGAAPEGLDGLPAPDAVFIGCGTAGGKTIEACWSALKPGGRIVVNSVTLESELALLAAYHARGGTLTRLGIERAEPVGRRMVWRPALPVVQWVARKPGAAA
jgi:precorrin-6Y C5,15-methyltransferase (decarboxylating)